MRIIKTICRLFILLVWLINGLYCKLLHGVPRHKAIVARILGDEYANLLTVLIGAGELFIFFWILSRYLPKSCAFVQIVLIAVMNSIELIMAPDLLLFGKYNGLLAILLMIIIYIEAFVLTDAGRHTYPLKTKRHS